MDPHNAPCAPAPFGQPVLISGAATVLLAVAGMMSPRPDLQIVGLGTMIVVLVEIMARYRCCRR